MITASIVTYQTESEELRNCLAALKKSGVDRIFVVDNGREDRIRAICDEFAVDYIPHPNHGYGAGHNSAIRMALAEKAEYHLVMNSDLEFETLTIRKATEYMQRHPDVGQLQPRIIGPDGQLQHTCRLLPTPADLILRRFMPRWLLTGSRRRYLLAEADWDREFDCAYQQGSFMLFRASALRETGLFDERFFMYPEDIDISRRMAQSGWKVRYWPGATIVHRHRAASYRSLRMLWIHITNMVKYFNKWGWINDAGRKKMNQMVLQQFKHRDR